MSDKPENPPAYPVDMDDGSGLVVSYGMTLLDHFAGQALASLTAPCMQDEMRKRRPDPDEAARQIAHGSYEIAEAMLAERTKRMERGQG